MFISHDATVSEWECRIESQECHSDLVFSVQHKEMKWNEYNANNSLNISCWLSLSTQSVWKIYRLFVLICVYYLWSVVHFGLLRLHCAYLHRWQHFSFHLEWKHHRMPLQYNQNNNDDFIKRDMLKINILIKNGFFWMVNGLKWKTFSTAECKQPKKRTKKRKTPKSLPICIGLKLCRLFLSLCVYQLLCVLLRLVGTCVRRKTLCDRLVCARSVYAHMRFS